MGATRLRQQLFWIGAALSLLLVLAACGNGITQTHKENPGTEISETRRQEVATPEDTPTLDRYINVRPGTYGETSKRAKAVMDKYEDLIWRQPNIHGAGIGLLVGEDGVFTGEVGIVISVTKKVQDVFLPVQDRIPATLEGIPVQILEEPNDAEFIPAEFTPPR